ncbi:ENOS interacting protein [Xylariaceae sp. FL0594]|nr:ENOS interacting protein [Xylariaceae sp. FL0594]
MSHSKRNTSRAVFTSYERELARKAWGANKARLGSESFLAFSACRLCLETAVDPVSCTHGDIFCRECALSNILAQKKEIKRLEKLKEQEGREAQERQAQLDAEAHERAIREFEMTQNGLDVRSRSSSAKPIRDEKETGHHDTNPSESDKTRKRKFEMDDEELKRIAADDRAKARKAIDDERAARPTLPSFWVPAVTPSSNNRDTLHEVAKKTKSIPICPASSEEKPHAYSLHSLVTVHFTEDHDEQGRETVRICPSCKKVLGNSSKAKLAKPCGHVLCGNCVDKFMRPNKHDPHATEPDRLQCYICDADLTGRSIGKEGNGQRGQKKKDKDMIKPGLVELRSEGTGYSAGGANEVRKIGTGGFQV